MVPSSPGAVASSATRRPAVAARCSTDCDASSRAGQSAADAQPLSTTSSSGPLPGGAGRPRSTGPARPATINPTAPTRSASSHGGVRDAVCAVAGNASSSRTAGNDSRRGAGGTTRSSHHSSGSPASASSSQGAAKVMQAQPRPGRGAKAACSASKAAVGAWSV